MKMKLTLEFDDVYDLECIANIYQILTNETENLDDTQTANEVHFLLDKLQAHLSSDKMIMEDWNEWQRLQIRLDELSKKIGDVLNGQ